MKKGAIVFTIIAIVIIVLVVLGVHNTSELNVSTRIDEWKGELVVTVYPNENTVPDRVYTVTVLFEGELVGSRTVCFHDTVTSSLFGNYVALTWKLAPGNPIYDARIEDSSKPVKDRRDLMGNIKVKITY